MPAALRSALRDHTSASHARLDASFGTFNTIGSYAEFLAATHAFRRAAEQKLAGFDAWPVQRIAHLAETDLIDIGETARPPLTFDTLPEGDAHAMGASYVLEGSALGARLLVRQAAAIGMTGTHGARHLAAQANERARWPRFLELLEDMPSDNHGAILEGAQQTFDFALLAYTGEYA